MMDNLVKATFYYIKDNVISTCEKEKTLRSTIFQSYLVFPNVGKIISGEKLIYIIMSKLES